MTDQQLMDIIERFRVQPTAGEDLDRLAAVIEQVTGRAPTLGDVREVVQTGRAFHAAPFS